MGKHNQQRRAEKRRQKLRQMGPRPRSDGGGTGAWGRQPSIDETLDAAVEANWHQDEPNLEMLLAMLAEGAGGRALPLAISGRLQRAVRGCWARGWQPADLAMVVGRKLGSAHRGLCVEVIAAEARAYVGGAQTGDRAWLTQLEELGVPEPRTALFGTEAGQGPGPCGLQLRRSVELIGFLEHAPALPRLRPTPSEWGAPARPGARHRSSPDEAKLLTRVRALLAKAESTDFPDEAEALTAKAQEIMARHAIDRAAVEDAGQSTVEGRRLQVDDPYAKAKAILLQTVAEANRCRSVWSEDLGFSTIFGAPDDLGMTDVLYTSLLTQATTAMVAAGAQGRRARFPSFRQSFLVAYAYRTGERLRGSVGAEVDAGVGRHGESLLPVLARRVQAVDEAVDAAFPDTAPRSLRTSNGFGWAAGRAAAELADLGVGERLCAPA